ncbi:penicillin-binding protein 1A [Devosia sp. 63-57]|uniref:penicillin-binding protein 1A n=1 Tax=Devosia sp. 63-57 TaxID=1895751 RepID=UPI000869D689|nr:penicillin-binding protein 1A [Devosia sp. 63-57]ODT50148.1 MAG: penicillin-binding protein [Pelagibacterium sp. SCN 63-126]ODU87387.1 MAG: penicillin-binding protein [Pelagibacterium sp. SCN 63-17]OJX44890.1 MAG: penicillin-binding protein [Devosia sp. 63-57]
MFRLLGWLFGFGMFLALAGVAVGAVYLATVTAQLPDYTVLKDYQPPVTTRVHAADGTLLAEYARERRLFQPIETVPPLLVQAFLSAEDKEFFSHGGIAFEGLVRAVRDNLVARMDGNNSIQGGGSSITQQVAKNFLLTSEQTWDRKIQEAILAIRIESTFTKEKILELYLNEIFLGLNSYGVAAAALNYFDKALYQLTLSEAAYIAALPKGPNNYHPFRRPQAAIERRNWVIDRMVENGYVTAADAAVAKAEPLNVIPRAAGSQLYSAEYFTEEVRRELAKLYGEDQLYGGGLSVRTTLEPRLQEYARRALMDGLIAFDHGRGFRTPVASIELGDDWGVDVAAIKPLSDVPEWQLAVVLEMGSNQATIGLRPDNDVDGALSPERTVGTLSGPEIRWVSKPLQDILKVGDVVYVSPVAGKDGIYTLEQVPEIEGALVAMDPRTGRVLAMVGGFSFAESEFNRATQALRQPGSSFKPIVYAAALDNGYTPASVVLDAPVEVRMADGSVWRPENYSQQFYGPQTLRRGIERSRNVMTVRLARDIGMPLIADYARMFGIYDDMQPVLAMALGAGETTDMRMTAAYATIANGGRKIVPTLIDRIQDRYGTTVYRHDHRICDGCAAEDWHGQGEPRILDNREQVLDPMTAYQITSMMEGVVQRGTGTAARALNRPVAGKTGTTNDYKDAWFVGFTPELAVGIYIGYDKPRSMGSSSTGGGMAVPIFTNFMAKALQGKPPTPFNVPTGMTTAWINPNTGAKAFEGEAAIQEAFKPGSGPNQMTSIIGIDVNAMDAIQRQQNMQQQYGGGISTQPSGNGGFMDPSLGRGGLF